MPTQIRIARSSEQELNSIEDFFDTISKMYYDEESMEAIGSYVIEQTIDKSEFSIDRIILGYRVMIENAFDQNESYLKFNERINRLIVLGDAATEPAASAIKELHQ